MVRLAMRSDDESWEVIRDRGMVGRGKDRVAGRHGETMGDCPVERVWGW